MFFNEILMLIQSAVNKTSYTYERIQRNYTGDK